MNQEIIIRIADWVFSILLMASFLVASIRGEKFDTSLQFNWTNVVASMAFIAIALSLGTYGYACRQTFFLVVSSINLVNRKKKLQQRV